MPERQDGVIDEVMDQLVAPEPAGMVAVVTKLFNLAMRSE